MRKMTLPGLQADLGLNSGPETVVQSTERMSVDLTRRLFCAASGAIAAAPAAAAGSREHVISGAWPAERLAGVLAPAERWKPFPTINDRAAWQSLPADVRQAAISEGAAHAGKPWTELPATLYLEYRRNGNRSRFQAASFQRRYQLASLAIAECVEAKGRYLDDLANGIWAICEESFWGVPASYPSRDGLPDTTDPGVELFAAETSALLAWTDYLLGDRLDTVSSEIRRRLRREADRRILAPCLARDDFWWMGFHPHLINNWTPWICSNWLATALLLESDAKRRVASVHKALRCLDHFLAVYHDDGGCEEGPSYWYRAGASLFDCLELLRSASSGAIDLCALPLVREIGRYIYRAHVAGPWFVNFADAPARPKFSGDVVHRFGRAIGDQTMTAFGAWKNASGTTVGDGLGRLLPALFNISELRRSEGSPPLLRDVWLPGTQIMAARCAAGSSRGLFLAAQGGHNAESHNHNDVGNFVVFADGEPAIIDVGVETYTAKTFSPQRYEIWTMQSAYHNCPTIGGVMQAAGRQHAASEIAYRADGAAAEFSLNLANAYPAEAGIRRWIRTLRLDRSANRIEITDRYALNQAPEHITLTLMTASRPVVSAGSVVIEGRARVLFDAGRLQPKIEEIPVHDAALRASWGDRIHRVQLVADRPPVEGALRISIEQ